MFAVTAVVMLVVGVVIGFLATYCVMKKRNIAVVQQSQQQVQDGDNMVGNFIKRCPCHLVCTHTFLIIILKV